MASIHPNKDRTRWRVLYRVDGKQRSDTFLTHTDALRHKARVEQMGGDAARTVLDALEGRTGPDTRTVADYAFAHVARLDGITEGTRVDYERMIRNRLAGTPLGELPLEAVTRDACSGWVRSLPGATKTRRNYHTLLSSVFNAAVVEGAMPTNPARAIKIKQDAPVSDMVILTPGELATLVAAIPVRYQALVLTLAGTGLRFGEATALTVGAVDLDARVPLLRVTQAWQRTGTGARKVGPPKTRAGVRTVSLSPEVVAVLEPLVTGRRQRDYVFTNSRGNPILSANFHRSVWGPTLTRLEAEGALTKRPRVHDLRHFHASQLVAAGVPLNVVQRRLGHESITTTVDRYSHLAPDYLEVSAAAASLGLVQAVPAIEAG